MASVKIVLRKKPNQDKTCPLFLRITKNRVSSYISLGHSTALDSWDAKAQRVKKNHPNAVRLNNYLIKKLAEANDKLLELQTNDSDTSSRSIRNGFKAAGESTFFKHASFYCEQLRKQGKYNRLSAERPRIERFKEFLNNTDISFSDITVPLLQKFKAYLKGTRSISDRTVVNHLVVIRTLFNQAIAANIVDRKHYPFGKGKIVIKFPDSLKVGLSKSDVTTLETLELTSGENHARNLWLFAYYFAGMRISDVLRLKWSDFYDNRLFYAMGKNAKGGSLKIPAKAQHILEQYRRPDPKHDLVFPSLESLEDVQNTFAVQRRIKSRVHDINDYLKEVAKKAKLAKPLTMHIARHTFGNISGDKIPVQMLQKLYRHTHITTTIGYQQNFIYKDADEALDAVVNF